MLSVWQRGSLLDTRITKKFSKEEWQNSQYIENCMIFKNFSYFDKGKSRIFIMKLNTPEEVRKRINKHNKLIFFINRLKQFYKKDNHAINS